MVRPTLVPARHRIRVQVMFWTSILLLIAMVVPLELRLRIDEQYLQQDLVDRSREVLNDVAAELGGMEFLEEDADDVQTLLLKEVVRVPSIVELSVFEYTPSGTRLIASTVKPPDVTPERLGKITRETGYIFTLVGIAAVLLILNYIFQRKIGRPLDEILAVMGKAHVGDYSE